MVQEQNKPSYYSKTMILLHWGIAVLVTVHLVNAFTLHLLRDFKTVLIVQELHRSFGLLIVLAMGARLIIRLIDKAPQLTQDLPIWQRLSAKATHIAFYIILLSAPFIGWAYTNSIGMPVSFFWFLPLPNIAAYNPDVGFVLLDLHIYSAIGLLALISIHIGASFYNKFILKNMIFEKILFQSTHNIFSSYLPVWLRMSVASGVALLACAIIGYSGLRSTNTIGEAYDKVFHSVIKIRAAQAKWENFNTKIAWNELKEVKDIRSILDKISSTLEQSINKIEKKATALRVNILRKKIQNFSNREGFDILKVPSVRVEMNKISNNFNAIIQELAGLVFETKQHFETLAAQQNDQVVLTLVIIFCLSAITIIFMTATTSVQITRANQLATEILRGNVDAKLDVHGSSETAQLMQSLESMRESIKNQRNWAQDTQSEYQDTGNHLREQDLILQLETGDIMTTTIDISDYGFCINLVAGLSCGQTFSIIDHNGNEKPVIVTWIKNEIVGLDFLDTKQQAISA